MVTTTEIVLGAFFGLSEILALVDRFQPNGVIDGILRTLLMFLTPITHSMAPGIEAFLPVIPPPRATVNSVPLQDRAVQYQETNEQDLTVSNPRNGNPTTVIDMHA